MTSDQHRRAPLSGRQYDLTHEAYSATVASVGASLRTLQHDGRDLVVPFGADELRPRYRGATLAPWPNRVVDGRYEYAGETLQLALNEPDRGHALHGLVAWQDFEGSQTEPDGVELAAYLPAQEGYPHQLQVRVAFRLDDYGLLVSVTGTNIGATSAPWGTGPHPYLVAGPGRVDDWSLELPASQVLTTTPDRLIPVGLADVGTEQDGQFDFRQARRLGSTAIDHAFTGLTRDAPGDATVRLRTEAGDGVAMTFGAVCPWVQVHTADRPEPAQHRLGLAVEPMTCAPDAFNSGLGLLHLGPGESHQASWRIAALT